MTWDVSLLSVETSRYRCTWNKLIYVTSTLTSLSICSAATCRPVWTTVRRCHAAGPTCCTRAYRGASPSPSCMRRDPTSCGRTCGNSSSGGFATNLKWRSQTEKTRCYRSTCCLLAIYSNLLMTGNFWFASLSILEILVGNIRCLEREGTRKQEIYMHPHRETIF